jgi:hypothetical protein
MGEQLGMQKEDYEEALKSGDIFLCNDCQALSISSCEDVTKGQCFYCGSKKINFDKKEIRKTIDRLVKEELL